MTNGAKANLAFYGIYGLILALSLPLGIWWQRYKYHDCLKVGHSKTYCVLSIGR